MVVVLLEAKAMWPPQRTEESWSPAGAGWQPESVGTMPICSTAFSFWRLLAHPTGVALQDTKLGAGGGFLGTGGRKI